MSQIVTGLWKLQLKIVNCLNVPIADPNGKSDPFVQVYMENQFVGMTQVKREDLNPVFNFQFPPIALTTLDTTLRFEIYDEDIGKDNDLLGIVILRLDKIVDGTQTLHVEAVELKQGQLQSLVQMGHTVIRGARGPFTMTIDAHILENISLSEGFLSLPKVESLVASPPSRISFVAEEDWETLSVLQQEEIVNCVESLKQLGYSEEQVKEDVFRFLYDLHHLRRPSNESINFPPSQAIYREDPAIKNSTKFMILNDGHFLPSLHTPIYPEYSLQFNLSEDERAFRLIIFRSRYVLLSWFEWIQAAFVYWKGGMNRDQFHLQNLMEDLCEVRSNIDTTDSPGRRVEVKLDLDNSFNIKIGNTILSLDQLSSIVISVDSVRSTSIVAEVQVTANEVTSYDSYELSDGFRRFKIDLKNAEKVGLFDFHSEEDDDDEDIRQMNRVIIEGKHQNKVIGSGVLNLHDAFTQALAAGSQDFGDGMRVSSRVLMSEIREYRIHDLTVVMVVPIYTNLSIQVSLRDENDKPIGPVQKISLARDSRTATIIRTTLSEVILQASHLSTVPKTIKMEVYAPTAFGMMNTLLGSYKLFCEQMTENDERKVIELESNAKLHFTYNYTTHRQEVETMVTFRASNLRNNLWYGECGNLNSEAVKLLVFPDHHQLQLFSKCSDGIDKVKLFQGIPWSRIRHVRPLTPSILSVHYHHGPIPQCLYLFNCPSNDLASLFAKRIEVVKARDLVRQILFNDETCQIPQILRLFNTVVEAISLSSASIAKPSEQSRVVKRICIKKLYLLEVIHTKDWNDCGATRLHEELLQRCRRIEDSFPVSSTSFYLDDFRNMVQRIDALFSELEELFCIAIMKAVKEIDTCRVNSMKALLSATSVLQEFTRRIFYVIGPCFSHNFYYSFLQLSPSAATLYSSQNAWRRIMLLHQQIKKKFEHLQYIYEKVFGLKFQRRIPLDDHLPFSYLQDSFITSFIIDLKKTIYNHLKSAIKGISSTDGFIAVQDFVIAQHRALNHGQRMLIDFHQKDCDLMLNGIDLTAIKHEIFSLEDVNRRAGFIVLDVLLSMVRRVEEEVLPMSENEWNLLVFEPGSTNTTAPSDLMVQESWRRCVDYSMQVMAFASGLQEGERSIWKNLTEEEELRIIPEKVNCVQLLHYHCNERMIGQVLDHLSSGLCQYLYYLKLLSDQMPSDPSSFMKNLTDLLSSIERYLVVERKEHHFWEQIATNLRDRVLSKCFIHFFGVLANETSSFSLNEQTVRQLGSSIHTLYGFIKLYLINQHHVDSEVGWLCLLQTHYPLVGFALLAFSLLHSFITVKPNELSQVVALLVQYYKDCMMNHKSLDSSADNTMKAAISHYLQMCFHLRLRYYSDEDITRLDSLVQECEEALSLIHLESTISTENLSHFIPLNPIAVVFGKRRGYLLPSKPEGSSPSRTPFARNIIAWDVRPLDDLLRTYVLRRPVTKQSSPTVDGSIKARRSSWLSFPLSPTQPSVDRSKSDDDYSLLSKMHLLYSRSEIDEVSSKIKTLHRFDQTIPRYHHNRMNSQQLSSSASASFVSSSFRPPDRIVIFTEIQLLNMFYLPNNNLLRSFTNSSFFLYTIIQIGDQWIYATEKVVGKVFNANLLTEPIKIPIYHPLTSFNSSSLPMNGNVVKSQYLSEDIVIYVVYSTNDSNTEVNLLNDRIIGLCQTTLYHYHPLNQHCTTGRFLINTKDEYVERAQTTALNEGRKLPSLTFSYIL